MSSTLTPKEERITALVVQGMKNHEISKIIGTTENVIENYLRIIFDKTGTWTRLELALWYLENKRIEDCQYGCGDLPLGCGPRAITPSDSSLKLGNQIPNEISTAKTIMSTNSGTATPGNNVRSSATKSAPVKCGPFLRPAKIVAR
jgi:DNA-binding CsgD family transcriptional regulator